MQPNADTLAGGVGKQYISPVGRPTGSVDPIGPHYIGPVGNKAGS